MNISKFWKKQIIPFVELYEFSTTLTFKFALTYKFLKNYDYSLFWNKSICIVLQNFVKLFPGIKIIDI